MILWGQWCRGHVHIGPQYHLHFHRWCTKWDANPNDSQKERKSGSYSHYLPCHAGSCHPRICFTLEFPNNWQQHDVIIGDHFSHCQQLVQKNACWWDFLLACWVITRWNDRRPERFTQEPLHLERLVDAPYRLGTWKTIWWTPKNNNPQRTSSCNSDLKWSSRHYIYNIYI